MIINQFILILSIKMEVLIDLIQPHKEFPINYAPGITEVHNGRGEISFEYGFRNYKTLEQAVATAVVRKLEMVDEPHIVRAQFTRILNPPSDYFPEEGDVFDLDIRDIEDVEEMNLAVAKGDYVSKYQYYTSCPHHDATHIRRVENGLISCNIYRLVMYSKIKTWYSQNKDQLVSRSPLLPVTHPSFDFRLEYIVRKILKDVDENPVQVFENYKLGINKKLHINTLEKNGLLFDYKLGGWYTIKDKAPYVAEERLMIFKLDALLTLEHSLQRDQTQFLEEIIPLAISNPQNLKIITSSLFIELVKTYFEGLHQYPNHVFDLNRKTWVVSNDNGIYSSPQIVDYIFQINNYGQGGETFIEVITNINNLNN